MPNGREKKKSEVTTAVMWREKKTKVNFYCQKNIIWTTCNELTIVVFFILFWAFWQTTIVVFPLPFFCKKQKKGKLEYRLENFFIWFEMLNC